MIINSDMKNEFVSYSIFTGNIDETLSDHYLVQMGINPDKEQVKYLILFSVFPHFHFEQFKSISFRQIS